jgi:hypothetical protein
VSLLRGWGWIGVRFSDGQRLWTIWISFAADGRLWLADRPGVLSMARRIALPSIDGVGGLRGRRRP